MRVCQGSHDLTGLFLRPVLLTSFSGYLGSNFCSLFFFLGITNTAAPGERGSSFHFLKHSSDSLSLPRPPVAVKEIHVAVLFAWLCPVFIFYHRRPVCIFYDSCLNSEQTSIPKFCFPPLPAASLSGSPLSLSEVTRTYDVTSWGEGRLRWILLRVNIFFKNFFSIVTKGRCMYLKRCTDNTPIRKPPLVSQPRLNSSNTTHVFLIRDCGAISQRFKRYMKKWPGFSTTFKLK